MRGLNPGSVALITAQRGGPKTGKARPKVWLPIIGGNQRGPKPVEILCVQIEYFTSSGPHQAKPGRIDGSVTLDGQSIADMLIGAGLARR